MTSYKPVEAALRVLQVLQTLSRLGSAGVTEIHAATGINRPTVVRMLETLMYAGYVYRQEERGRYGLTAKALALSVGYQPAVELRHHAAPILAELQELIGWPSDVAICDGVQMVTVATSPPSGRISINEPAGYRAEIFRTSLGLAYIAFAADRERELIVRALAAHPGTWNDVARNPAVANRVLSKVRRRGYAVAITRASSYGALMTIGVPILVGARAIAAMNVIHISDSLNMRAAVRRFLPPLREAAARLATAAAPEPQTT